MGVHHAVMAAAAATQKRIALRTGLVSWNVTLRKETARLCGALIGNLSVCYLFPSKENLATVYQKVPPLLAALLTHGRR